MELYCNEKLWSCIAIKNISNLVLIAFLFGVVLLSGCSFLPKPTAPGEVIGQEFIKADDGIAKQKKSIIYFDVLQDKTLESFDQIFGAYTAANITMEYNNTMTGNVGLIWFDSMKMFIVDSGDSIAAGTLAVQMNSKLENDGYNYKGRVDYKDLCNVYEKDGKELFILQKDKFVFVLTEKPEETGVNV